MKKLRLIKPWHLRAVQQRVRSADETHPFVPGRPIPCYPAGVSQEQVAFRNGFTYNTVRFRHDKHTENPDNAPPSDAIFVLKRSIR